jgi:hypothetical protein
MPEGQTTTCNLYVEDRNEEDGRPDTCPVYVAAAVECVKIGLRIARETFKLSK